MPTVTAIAANSGGNLAPTAPGLTGAAAGGNLTPAAPGGSGAAAGGNVSPTAPALLSAVAGGNLAPTAPGLTGGAAGGNVSPSAPGLSRAAAGGDISPTAPAGLVAESTRMLITGALLNGENPVVFDDLIYQGMVNGKRGYNNNGIPTQFLYWTDGPYLWNLTNDANGGFGWTSEDDVLTPDLVTTWTPIDSASAGTPIVTAAVGSYTPDAPGLSKAAAGGNLSPSAPGAIS